MKFPTKYCGANAVFCSTVDNANGEPFGSGEQPILDWFTAHGECSTPL